MDLHEADPMAGFNMKVLFVVGSRRSRCVRIRTLDRKKEVPDYKSRKVSCLLMRVFTPVRRVMPLLRQEGALLIHGLQADHENPGLSTNIMVDPEGLHLELSVNYAHCKRRSQ